MEVLRMDDDLCVWRIAGTSDRLLISMSGIGDTDADQPAPQFMSFAQGTTDTMLFIADPRRSWLSRPGIIDEIKALIETEAARASAQQIVIFGASMGGFSALPCLPSPTFTLPSRFRLNSRSTRRWCLMKPAGPSFGRRFRPSPSRTSPTT
jgi:hypothetical protein